MPLVRFLGKWQIDMKEKASRQLAAVAGTLYLQARGHVALGSKVFDMRALLNGGNSSGRRRPLCRPRAALTRYGVRLTCLSFCAGAPVLVCGADDGSVVVYSMAGIYDEYASAEQEAGRLERALLASVYQQ